MPDVDAAIDPRSHAERAARATAALGAHAPAIVAAASAMAERLLSGGTLWCVGTGEAATDAQHLAVEFVHPVIVGKRALSAQSLTNGAVAFGDGDPTRAYAAQLSLVGRPKDIVATVSYPTFGAAARAALEAGRACGALTLSLGALGDAPGSLADHAIGVDAPEDVLVAKEVLVTAYHLLWETVHVFIEAVPASAGAHR